MNATRDDFEQANRAFDLFTMDERKRALEVFAGLRYPLIVDRFFEAVHTVICEQPQAVAAVDPVDGIGQEGPTRV